MAQYKYEIGTSIATLTNVEDITTKVLFEGLAPRGMAVRPYSYYHVAASGREYGDGYPHTQWEFDAIPQDDKDTLNAYLNSGQSAEVYIRTRDEKGAYNIYKAIMHRPKQRDEGEYEDGIWKRVIYRFTMLELQEEPEE